MSVVRPAPRNAVGKDCKAEQQICPGVSITEDQPVFQPDQFAGYAPSPEPAIFSDLFVTVASGDLFKIKVVQQKAAIYEIDQGRRENKCQREPGMMKYVKESTGGNGAQRQKKKKNIDSDKGDEPPGVEYRSPFDIQNKKMVQQHQQGHRTGEGQGRNTAEAQPDVGQNERKEYKDGKQVQEVEQSSDIQEADQPAAGYILKEIRAGREYGEVLEEKADDKVDGKIIQQQAAEDRDQLPAGKQMQQDIRDIQANHEAGCQYIEEAKAYQQPEDKGFARPAASPESLPLV